MLELTTLIIFTWLTLRVRYFHSYFKDFIVFDLNLNNYALIRWFYSLIMTNDPTTNQKSTPTSSTVLTTDGLLTMTRTSKLDLCILSDVLRPRNLMQFVEEIPSHLSVQPHPRSGHRAVATESDLWIWGGYYPAANDQPERMFEELWRYNFALRRWTLEQTTGEGPLRTLASHSMCRLHNSLLVFGGTGFPFGRHVSKDLFVLDMKRRNWRRCQIKNQAPQEVYGASILLHDDHLYILCGTNSWIYNSNIFQVHLPTLSSTQIGSTFDEIEDPSETGRYRQESYFYKGKIFVFGGGGVSGISYSLENLPVFDLATQQWSFVHTNPDPVHNFPKARKFHSIFPYHHNQVIMFGGAHYNRTTHCHDVVNERLWTFNFDKLEWSILPSLTMVQPTYFHAAAMNERGEIWIHGGIVKNSTATDEDADDSNIRTTALYTMHTRVLNLSELTWNRLLNAFPDRSCLIEQPELLTQLSVPSRFIARIH